MSADALMAFAVPWLALLIDRRFGEPRPRWHPVVGMGRLLAALAPHVPARPARAAFVRGALAWLLGALGVVAVALALQQVPRWLADAAAPWGALAAAGLAAWLLKPLLALRLLVDEVRAVEAALGESLAAGRTQVARLCSRDTAALDATAVRETAIESLAENLNDSLIAPLFWFALAGLPGAALYRWANTADACWGYRDARWEWAGKFAARADDVLSWLPARLTALLLWPRGQGAALRREARRTPSPNGGWPMAAMALRLGIRLGKPGVYRLNAPGRAPVAGDIERALRHARRAAWLGAGALGLLAALAVLALQRGGA
ncbi:MAG TPA: adenosylcobinamide-phosphate synthase CbiB [Methylibium sp.]|nr:adenosylcobinamide-phosphate synthase CbiB [Methylibium sp.]